MSIDDDGRALDQFHGPSGPDPRRWRTTCGITGQALVRGGQSPQLGAMLIYLSRAYHLQGSDSRDVKAGKWGIAYMGIVNDRLTWRPSSSSGEIRDARASPRVGRFPPQTGTTAPNGTLDFNLQIMLIIQDDIRRYSIEGMLRSLDIRLAVQFGADIESISTFRNGQLIISSSNSLEPMSPEIAEKLRSHNIHVLVLVDSKDVVEQSWVDHANGFLDWADLRPETLREAIVDVETGRFHVSATLARRSVTAPDQAGDDTTSKRASMIALTAREHQVLRLISEGQSNRQVAGSLGISEHGVKRMVGIILAKLNCPNRTLAVVRAIESGLLDV
ncbi:response regulator transcription factor [Streptomyces sp. NPDC020858]|uniref:response regulator transcription factor n=1 Tax=Streptomyces sp. NPDC020858 TaxID=3365097 RepID=UPI003798188F